MSGVSGLVKLILAGLIIFAAATGTEAIDVVELADDMTIKAQSYFNDVEVDGDESGLFDESVDEFARPSDKRVALAFEDSASQDSPDVDVTTDDTAVVDEPVGELEDAVAG